jgi:hypothetical protein
MYSSKRQWLHREYAYILSDVQDDLPVEMQQSMNKPLN